MDFRTKEYIWSLIFKFFMGIIIGYTIGLYLFTPVRADTIKQSVQYHSRTYNIDPDLVMAIIKVESNFNPKAVGAHGEIGLMQLRKGFFPGAEESVDKNIQLGVAYLSFVQVNCPHKTGLLFVYCYNQGISRKPKHPHLLPYVRKVSRAYKEIKKARQAKAK